MHTWLSFGIQQDLYRTRYVEGHNCNTTLRANNYCSPSAFVVKVKVWRAQQRNTAFEKVLWNRV
jgi:hypothetical protein